MKLNKKYLAIGLCLIIGLLATFSTSLQSSLLGRVVIGGPMVALLVSMIACNILPNISKEFKEGTTFSGKKFLNWGIILTGGTLSFKAILGTGVKALPLILFNLLLAFTVAFIAGKKLKVSSNTSILVGGGTSICGGTAIGTLSRIIKAHEEEIAFAMAAIFLFDTIAAFSYPYLADLLNLSHNQFAFWAGTAINDTSSVAGAQATYVGLNNLKGFNGALNVKLVRTTMLIFVALFWTIMMAKREENKNSNESLVSVVKKTFPMFILWFVVMAGLNTFGVFGFKIGSIACQDILGKTAKFLFASALAGVGFKIKFSEVFSKGVKPIILGGLTWIFVCMSSLAFITIFAGYVG